MTTQPLLKVLAFKMIHLHSKLTQNSLPRLQDYCSQHKYLFLLSFFLHTWVARPSLLELQQRRLVFNLFHECPRISKFQVTFTNIISVNLTIDIHG